MAFLTSPGQGPYWDGDTVLVQATFTTAQGGALRDPVLVTLSWKVDEGSATTLSWPASNLITHVSTGVFTAKIDTTAFTAGRDVNVVACWGTPDAGFAKYQPWLFVVQAR